MKIKSSIFIFLICLVMPTFVMSQTADSLLVVEHLTKITKAKTYRNYKNIEQLNEIADYIHEIFEKYADTTYFQNYYVENNIYKNVICRFGDTLKPLIVVGAHYDVCGNQEGADDNASGIVGLLELARLLQNNKELNYQIELVAYSLEEPPFFRTEKMGSYIHAKSLNDRGVNVYGMMAIEMIGFFSDTINSQDYPIKAQKLVFGSIGDYILVVKKMDNGRFVKDFSKNFKSYSDVEIRNKKAPAQIPGIDFSDHLNYWKFNYDALMVTNTSFYRNPNYHEKTDTMETLDIGRMTKIITAIYNALINIK